MKGHVRKRGERSWELKFDLGRNRLTRKRKTAYHSFRGTKREAQAELARLMTESNSGNRVAPSKQTLSEYLEGWLASIQPSVSPRTHEWHEYLIDNHIRDRLGGVLLQDLEPLDIQRFVAELLESGRRDGKGGLSNRTVRHVIATLSQALKQATDWGMVGSNPVAGVRRPKLERQEISILNDDEIAELFGAAKKTRLYVPILLALSTGLRRGELLALRWQDIDLDDAELAVNRALELARGKLRFKAPKSKSSRRRVTLPPLCVEVLREHRIAQMKERLALGLGRSDSDLVFPNALGDPWSPKKVSERFAHIVRTAKLDCTFHGLRHTHASQLLRDGVPVPTVSARLGHANPAITLSIYAHLLPGMEEQAAERTEAALRRALKE